MSINVHHESWKNESMDGKETLLIWPLECNIKCSEKTGDLKRLFAVYQSEVIWGSSPYTHFNNDRKS